MLVLALDTSTPACSVALVQLPDTAPPPGATRPLASRRIVDARRHGELLSPLMRDALAEAAVTPADLAGVVVGLGPGPFTSLRVGIVTAATFAAALGLTCHGVCSLDGIGAVTSGRTGVVTDARRREVFWAAYADGERIAGPAVDRPDRAADLLRADGVGGVVGPGLALYPDAFANAAAAHAGTGTGTGAAAAQYPDPAVLAALAAPDLLAGRAPAPLTPIYLRRPDVAEPRPAKAVTG
ncbi:tRNA (adenosine(37)-N6)-threonylcarbamoyltransferase complex dimerization subunit type 1 TsaB [Pseudofrankia asymbiotica]|uniref:tRNA (Adenosine(37)-N6)-threonylcarbamoyltransferase complex dimerization subunit type 1 TsaB n=1 Tax=Pseudofrankia asymbiotica TaxID=1834516 RepID=A0A1V2IFZ0_9ACTN|nr:tRNA (adenosine(37)-N6)-threonylcarbamoyltransferase complex dimerization subunit type 1 TsaB [Pseudofrankia asymbiotica]ONH32133.1 tRNA (adenosine(37)-N6)-threonylcarbamoyltransferase complex dimerization subunit type 1 TsaB [Pseudofrankia asymbiotica]